MASNWIAGIPAFENCTVWNRNPAKGMDGFPCLCPAWFGFLKPLISQGFRLWAIGKLSPSQTQGIDLNAWFGNSNKPMGQSRSLIGCDSKVYVRSHRLDLIPHRPGIQIRLLPKSSIPCAPNPEVSLFENSYLWPIKAVVPSVGVSRKALTLCYPHRWGFLFLPHFHESMSNAVVPETPTDPVKTKSKSELKQCFG